MLQSTGKNLVYCSVFEIPWAPYRYDRNLDKIEEFPWNLKNDEGVAEDLTISKKAIAQPLHRLFKVAKKPNYQMHLEEMYQHYPNISKTQVNAALALSNNNVEDAKIILELQIKLKCEHNMEGCNGKGEEEIFEPLNLTVDSQISLPEEEPKVSHSKVKIISNTIISPSWSDSSTETCRSSTETYTESPKFTNYINGSLLMNMSIVDDISNIQPQPALCVNSSKQAANRNLNAKENTSSRYNFNQKNTPKIEETTTDANDTSKLRNYRKDGKMLLNNNIGACNTTNQNVTKQPKTNECGELLELPMNNNVSGHFPSEKSQNIKKDSTKIHQVTTDMTSKNNCSINRENTAPVVADVKNKQHESLLIKNSSGHNGQQTTANLSKRNYIVVPLIPNDVTSTQITSPTSADNPYLVISKNGLQISLTEAETQHMGETILEGVLNRNLNNTDLNSSKGVPEPCKYTETPNNVNIPKLSISTKTSNTISTASKKALVTNDMVTRATKSNAKNKNSPVIQNASNKITKLNNIKDPVEIPQNVPTGCQQQESTTHQSSNRPPGFYMEPQESHDSSFKQPAPKQNVSKAQSIRIDGRLLSVQPYNSLLLPNVPINASQVPAQAVNNYKTRSLPQCIDPRLNQNITMQTPRYVDNRPRNMPMRLRNPGVSVHPSQNIGPFCDQACCTLLPPVYVPLQKRPINNRTNQTSQGAHSNIYNNHPVAGALANRNLIPNFHESFGQHTNVNLPNLSSSVHSTLTNSTTYLPKPPRNQPLFDPYLPVTLSNTNSTNFLNQPSLNPANILHCPVNPPMMAPVSFGERCNNTFPMINPIRGFYNAIHNEENQSWPTAPKNCNSCSQNNLPNNNIRENQIQSRPPPETTRIILNPYVMKIPDANSNLPPNNHLAQTMSDHSYGKNVPMFAPKNEDPRKLSSDIVDQNNCVLVLDGSTKKRQATEASEAGQTCHYDFKKRKPSAVPANSSSSTVISNDLQSSAEETQRMPVCNNTVPPEEPKQNSILSNISGCSRFPQSVGKVPTHTSQRTVQNPNITHPEIYTNIVGSRVSKESCNGSSSSDKIISLKDNKAVPANSGSSTVISNDLQNSAEETQRIPVCNNTVPPEESKKNSVLSNISGCSRFPQSVGKVPTHTSQRTVQNPNIAHPEVSTNTVGSRVSKESCNGSSSSYKNISLKDNKENNSNLHPTGFTNTVGSTINNKSLHYVPKSTNQNTMSTQVHQKTVPNKRPTSSTSTVGSTLDNESLKYVPMSTNQNTKSSHGRQKNIHNMHSTNSTDIVDLVFDYETLSYVPYSSNHNSNSFQGQKNVSNMHPTNSTNTAGSVFNNKSLNYFPNSTNQNTKTSESQPKKVSSMHPTNSTNTVGSVFDNRSLNYVPNRTNQNTKSSQGQLTNVSNMHHTNSPNTVDSVFNNESLYVPYSTNQHIKASEGQLKNVSNIHPTNSPNTVGSGQPTNVSNMHPRNLPNTVGLVFNNESLKYVPYSTNQNIKSSESQPKNVSNMHPTNTLGSVLNNKPINHVPNLTNQNTKSLQGQPKNVYNINPTNFPITVGSVLKNKSINHVPNSTNQNTKSLQGQPTNVTNMYPTNSINTVSSVFNNESLNYVPYSTNQNAKLSQGQPKNVSKMHRINSLNTVDSSSNNKQLNYIPNSTNQSTKSSQGQPPNACSMRPTNTVGSVYNKESLNRIPYSTNRNIKLSQGQTKDVSHIDPISSPNTVCSMFNNELHNYVSNSTNRNTKTSESQPKNVSSTHPTNSTNTVGSVSVQSHCHQKDVPKVHSTSSANTVKSVLNNESFNIVDSMNQNNRSSQNDPQKVSNNVPNEHPTDSTTEIINDSKSSRKNGSNMEPTQSTNQKNSSPQSDQNKVPNIVHCTDATNTVASKTNNESSKNVSSNQNVASLLPPKSSTNCLQSNTGSKNKKAKKRNWKKEMRILLIQLKIAFVTFYKVVDIRKCSQVKQKRYRKALLRIRKLRKKIERRMKRSRMRQQNKSKRHVPGPGSHEDIHDTHGQSPNTSRQDCTDKIVSRKNMSEENTLNNACDVNVSENNANGISQDLQSNPLSVYNFSEVEYSGPIPAEKLRTDKPNQRKRSAVQPINSSTAGRGDEGAASKNIKMRIIKENNKYVVNCL